MSEADGIGAYGAELDATVAYECRAVEARERAVRAAPTHAGDALRLLRVVQDLALARDLEGVTGIVKRAARELTTADGVSFILRDEENCYYVDEDAISPLWKGRKFPMESCISGWAMTYRETVVIEDIYADSRIPHEAYRPTFVKSLVMTPVRSADPIAAIGTYWAYQHRPAPRELELLQSLADTAAVAIDNIQLIEALKRRAEESARLLDEFKREVARREELEAQFRQVQKMESIGRLAGGVAHDFNNLLTVISGYSDMALERVADDGELRSQLLDIGEAVERASALTQQLLAFSRKQVLRPEVINLNEVVGRTDKMLRRLIGEDIDLVTKLDPKFDAVKFDPGQIEQILMNLAVNARDAMPRGGKLTIETVNVDLDQDYASVHADAQPGPHVMIAVSDTGGGMDAETRSKIFEPFFTTKEPGKGTGLGLATVYGIVKQSGGSIWVYSEPGHGTTFKVYLPRAEEAAVPARRPIEMPEPSGGAHTILLVEDDEAVRRLLCTVLERAGYTVLATGDVDQALTICREHDGTLDLLLTDLVLPKMDGRQLSEKARSVRSDMKVVYMSGYAGNAVVHHGVLGPDAAFIEKPVAPGVLLERIGTFLSG